MSEKKKTEFWEKSQNTEEKSQHSEHFWKKPRKNYKVTSVPSHVTPSQETHVSGRIIASQTAVDVDPVDP